MTIRRQHKKARIDEAAHITIMEETIWEVTVFGEKEIRSLSNALRQKVDKVKAFLKDPFGKVFFSRACVFAV